ncbi:MAG: NusG domain II-containing protein [Gemmatimonadetes bacterium]|nr:NusG domain II-containing protein [Gemmatimonadota bacterium]
MWRLNTENAPALTRADKILALVVGLSAIGLVLYGRYTAEAGDVLIVELAGAAPATHALSNYGVLPVAGSLGVSEIEIGPKGARVLSAPCVHKICMRQGWLQRAGDVTACVPNGLVLRIAGAAPIDAMIR